MFNLLVIFLIALLPSGGGPLAQELPPAPETGPAFFEWQVLEARTGRSLSFEDLIGILSTQDVIYIGEEHHNRFHVMAAVKILEALVSQGRRPAVALEMFSWDVQPAITRHLTEQTSIQTFLEAVQWERTWGGAYEDYAPLIDFARERHLRVLALNPPRSLVRRVVSVGLAKALRESEAIAWGMQDIPEDRPYADLISKQIMLCHPGLSEQGYQRMYEASQFRDEGMAKIITDYLRDRQSGQGPLLSYTGGGHIQYDLPIPKRVLRRQNGQAQQATIYLTSFEGSRNSDIKPLLQEGIADYVWLTPPSAHGVPRRCG